MKHESIGTWRSHLSFPRPWNTSPSTTAKWSSRSECTVCTSKFLWGGALPSTNFTLHSPRGQSSNANPAYRTTIHHIRMTWRKRYSKFAPKAHDLSALMTTCIIIQPMVFFEASERAHRARNVPHLVEFAGRPNQMASVKPTLQAADLGGHLLSERGNRGTRIPAQS